MSHDELEFKSRRSEVYDQMEEKGRQSDMETGANYSYTERNPNLTHLRKSPTRLVNLRQSMSPSRGNHTDSEILNSPTQVLYATISLVTFGSFPSVPTESSRRLSAISFSVMFPFTTPSKAS